MSTVDESPTEKRIRELKERAAERAKAKEADEREAFLTRLEYEDMAAVELEKAEAKYGKGRAGVVMTDEGPVVLKAPEAPTFRKFQDRAKYETEPMLDLVLPNVVYPTRKAFEDLNDRLPATLARCASKVCELGGQRVKDLEGK